MPNKLPYIISQTLGGNVPTNTTKTAQFTPGPWVVHTFTISGKEKLEVLDATGTNACVQANAHLIAAAPAMYEALKALVDAFPSVVKMTPYGVSMDISRLHDNAKAALSQAEGW